MTDGQRASTHQAGAVITRKILLTDLDKAPKRLLENTTERELETLINVGTLYIFYIIKFHSDYILI